MIQKLNREEFARVLRQRPKGTAERLTVTGLVKADDPDTHFDFAWPETRCARWVQMPAELVESVELLGHAACADHTHQLVSLTLRSPDSPLAVVLGALLAQHRPTGELAGLAVPPADGVAVLSSLGGGRTFSTATARAVVTSPGQILVTGIGFPADIMVTATAFSFAAGVPNVDAPSRTSATGSLNVLIVYPYCVSPGQAVTVAVNYGTPQWPNVSVPAGTVFC
jgi:hypothetical protein